MDLQKLHDLTIQAVNAALAAGEKILEVYNSSFDVNYKTDNSPLTLADQLSHEIIIKQLSESGFPVLSEEGKSISFEERNKWTYYWLVDPLDGTKEFVNRNGEFTVNIALIKHKTPLMGVIFQPVQQKLYCGMGAGNLFCFDATGIKNITLSDLLSHQITAGTKDDSPSLRVVASRSHLNDETKNFIEKLKLDSREVELVNAGSSLKFCLLAGNDADIYPRFGPTMEWDTAAGHAILIAAGKNIYLWPSGMEMTYNKEDLLNDPFIAR
jgi:3'(2'), 5'-bisphosphate nucleotidase